MELFNNKDNDYLKFKINSEGVDSKTIEPRLILTTNENKNYLFIGKLDGDVCKFSIPELKMYEKGDTGKIKFEIISEEMYFPVWEDTFEVNTKSSIKIQEMVSEAKEEKKKPSISVVQPIIEKNDDEEEQIVEKKEEIKKPTQRKSSRDIQEPVPKYKSIDNSEIKNFNSFFGNK